MANRPRRYFDSDVVIRLVENRPEASAIQTLVNEAASGRWKLVLSAISMLEVTRSPGKPVDPAKFARIASFFENEFIFRRDLDMFLVESALALIYDFMWLRPWDAAHLAAAIDTGCQIFYTYDQDLIDKFDNERGLRVVTPGTYIEVDVTDLPLFKTPDSANSE